MTNAIGGVEPRRGIRRELPTSKQIHNLIKQSHRWLSA
jgi:hypothetical protein